MGGMNLKAIRELNVSDNKNILDVEVPAALDVNIDTGIGFLNDAFGGAGMTPSTCAIVTGDPGAGKTTLMLQCADAMTSRGHQVIYNGREEAVEQMRRVARRLDLKHGFIVGQERKVPTLIAQMKALRAQELAEIAIEAKLNPGAPERKPKQQILFIDSLQSHDDGFYKDGAINSMTQVRVCELLTDWCKETYGIAVIIGQVTKGGKIAGKQQLVHTVDVHAHLTIERDSDAKFFGCRLFSVIKNRFGCNGVTYALDLTMKGFLEKGQLGSLIEDRDE